MKAFSFFDLRKRPYDLLGLSALFLFLISFTHSNGSIDINLHDAYFVIANVNLYKIASGILLFLWSVNMIFHKSLFSGKLSRLTVSGTILSFVIVFTVLFTHVELPGPPRKYYSFTEFERMRSWYQYDNTIITVCILIAILLFIISQLAFIANIIGGLISKKTNRIVHDS